MAPLLPGVLLGHCEVRGRRSGASVVVLPPGSVAGVSVRGAAPGTRETDLLDPVNLVDQVDAVVLAGGSAFGLAAADGVVTWLAEHGRGLPTGMGTVPIVPAAVIFDLDVGDSRALPTAATGRSACRAAVPLEDSARVDLSVGQAQRGNGQGARTWRRSAHPGTGNAMGNVGAGAGASVGKLLGPDRAMRGGVGVAAAQAGGFQMAAVMVVNAVGDVVDPASGTLIAGARTAPGSLTLVDTTQALLRGEVTFDLAPGRATTIGVLVTDAPLTKAEATHVARAAHDGLARAIRPAHTRLDGDTLFAAATGTAASAGPVSLVDLLMLAALGAELTSAAIVAGVSQASTLRWGNHWLPAAGDSP